MRWKVRVAIGRVAWADGESVESLWAARGALVCVGNVEKDWSKYRLSTKLSKIGIRVETRFERFRKMYDSARSQYYVLDVRNEYGECTVSINDKTCCVLTFEASEKSCGEPLHYSVRNTIANKPLSKLARLLGCSPNVARFLLSAMTLHETRLLFLS